MLFKLSPDQLEDVVNKTGSVVAAEHGVVLLKLFDQCIPAARLVMNNVKATKVHVKFNPLDLLWQV